MSLRTTNLTAGSKRRSSRRDAFTLIELMISLAIALVLILGINQIFAISSKTVGAGQALGTISRDDRTAHAIMWPDVHNITLGPTPGLIITSQQKSLARSRIDSTTSNYRIDTLGFFASGDLYRRQTGGTGPATTAYLSTQTSTEAWIWYGHLALPTNATLTANPPTFYSPGNANAANDNNRYPSEFILGRMAMLLVPSPSGADVYMTAGATTGNPVGYDAKSSDGFNILTSRYDQTETSIALLLSNSITNTTLQRLAMVFDQASNLVNSGHLTPDDVYRFQANPFPNKPLSAINMAGIAPIFIRNCSQFIVEYAGDYITQDPTTGNMTAAKPDPVQTPGSASVIDFLVDANGTHKTRWYGYPRATNSASTTPDVIPLNYVRGTQASFEQFPATANTPPANLNTIDDTFQYVCSWGPDTEQNLDTNTGLQLDPAPKLLRITIALDDPSGRLAEPQVFEYVIDVQ